MKKIIIFLLLFFINANIVLAIQFDLYSDKVLFYNFETDQILFEKNSNEESQIASLTKLFTVYFSIVNIKDYNKKIILNDDVFYGLKEQDASVAGFKLYDKVTYLDLLYGAMLPSGADATQALAINLFGSEEEFARKMTLYMKELGLKHTSFKNSSGLTEKDHYSTVEDIYMFMKIALKNDLFKQIYESRSYTASTGLKIKSTYEYVKVRHPQINMDNYLLGLKSGFTDESGVCLATTAKYNDATYLLITTNAEAIGRSNQKNYYDAKTIYEYYINNYIYDVILSPNDVVQTIPIIYSKEKDYNIKIANDYKNLKNPNDNYEIKYNGLEKLSPISLDKGDLIGTVKILKDNIEIYSEKVYLEKQIKFSIIMYLIYYKEITILLSIITIIILFKIIIIKRPKKRFSYEK